MDKWCGKVDGMNIWLSRGYNEITLFKNIRYIAGILSNVTYSYILNRNGLDDE